MFKAYPDWEYTCAACQLTAFMLAMGAKLAPGQFVHVLHKPRSFLSAFACQLVALPLLAVAINHLAGIDTGLAVGLILLAAMPGGALSKIFTYLGQGNVPLAITLSGVSTLLTPITVPLMLRLLTRDLPETIDLPVVRIVAEVVFYVLLPLSLSMFLCHRYPHVKKPLSAWGVRVGLLIVLVMVVGSIGSGRIHPAAYGWSAPLAIIFFCVLGQQLIQIPFYLGRWPSQDRVAAGMEATMRNINLALLLYASLFAANPHLGPGVLFVLLFYSATSLVVAMPLAFRHRWMLKDSTCGGSHSAR